MHDSFDGIPGDDGSEFRAPSLPWALDDVMDCIGAVMAHHRTPSGFDLEGYLAELVETMVAELGAIGALLWRPNDGGGFSLEGGVNILITDRDRSHDWVLDQIADIEEAFTKKRARVLEPFDCCESDLGDQHIVDETFSLLVVLQNRSRILVPIIFERECVAVCEIFRTPTENEMEHAWSGAAATALCQKIEHDLTRIERMQLLQQVQRQNVQVRTAEAIASALGASNPFRECADAIQTLLGHGRVSIVESSFTSARVRAISRTNRIHRGHQRIAAIEQLSALIAKSGTPLIYPDDEPRMTGFQRQAMQRYHDVTATCSIAVLPLESTTTRSRVRNVLVVEGTDSTISETVILKKLSPVLPVLSSILEAAEPPSLLRRTIARCKTIAAQLFRK